MLKIKIPFGFKTLNLDNMFVLHTGKIRVKCSYAVVLNALPITGLTFSESKSGYTVIRYITTDYVTSAMYINSINSFLATLMHARIDSKYFNQPNELLGTSYPSADTLPF